MAYADVSHCFRCHGVLTGLARANGNAVRLVAVLSLRCRCDVCSNVQNLRLLLLFVAVTYAALVPCSAHDLDSRVLLHCYGTLTFISVSKMHAQWLQGLAWDTEALYLEILQAVG
jgi:hypothetical protein